MVWGVCLETESDNIDADAVDYAGWAMDSQETIDHGHGRVETRRYFTLTAVDKIPQAADWEKLNMIGMVQSEHQVNDKTRVETRSYFQIAF